MKFLRVTLFAVALLAPRSAIADDVEEVDDRKIVYNQKTEIDFDEVEVNGELVKPTGSLLIDRKRASFNPLIKIRRDWNIEIGQSVDEVK